MSSPWTEPGGVSTIPVPKAIEHADPGGVSWTKRSSARSTIPPPRRFPGPLRRRPSWRALGPATMTPDEFRPLVRSTGSTKISTTLDKEDQP